MHIALLTYGTRGDVQPLIALGLGLQRRGHSVNLAAPAAYAALVRSYGLACTPLAGDPGPLAQDLVDRAGHNPLRIFKTIWDFVLAAAPEVISGMRRACQGADLIVHTFLMTTGGHTLARELGVPDVSALFFPVFSPTAEFPPPSFPELPGRLFNKLSHRLVERLFWHGSSLGYRLIKHRSPEFPPRLWWPFAGSALRQTPRLYAISPSVLPRPADWGAGSHLTGYWFLDEPQPWQPPAALREFLEAGPPPVGVSFGSVQSGQAERFYAPVLHALRQTGQRGIILTGAQNWQPSPPAGDVLALSGAPHSWLFPRLAVVVHHGGAGTTAEGLRAGIPNVVVPFTTDQPFWAERVRRLGAGPQPIPAGKLDAERLTRAIEQAVSDGELRRRAAGLGQAIRGEDGVAQAVRLIVQHAEAYRST